MARAAKREGAAPRGRRGKPKTSAIAEVAGQDDPRAPLDPAAFLAAARPVLALLQSDLLARAEAQPAVARALTGRYEAERKVGRTADSFVEWRERTATQVAAAWLLSCVFVRTLEDRGLLATARLAGPGAMDSQTLFFELAPSLTEREYLQTVFRELASFPAARGLFDPAHALVFRLAPSADAARALLGLFRGPRAEAPAFRFGQADTRFLGDLYQDLDEGVRKRFALLQTPDFVESFILDRTLEPAIERFGLADTTLIDPTCGSGHFLLGAFARLFDRRLAAAPAAGPREAARRALDAVHGADLNPYAVAIVRFRLTLAYLDKAGFARLADAPALPLHLAVADSLLHNPHVPQPSLADTPGQSAAAWGGDLFALEDEAAARDVLHRHYAAVVGNPPYITPKDPAARDQYRKMYRSAAGLYSLAAPFCERFFQLARPRGLVGHITANSFMKREFGKKLIEDFLPTVNLSLVVNTSGAYIPGHGTPTVLLFGSNEPPVGPSVPAVLAKRGEPSTPDDPARGIVWSSIVAHVDQLGYEDDYLSLASLERETLRNHPWSLGGGGALELKELLEERAEIRLDELVASIGFMCITKQDEVFVQPRGTFARRGVSASDVRMVVAGEAVRDWAISSDVEVLFPYSEAGELIAPGALSARFLWPYRTTLESRAVFGGQTFRQAGRTWYEFGQIPKDRVAGPCIAFAEVATHNHFVLDRGGKVFNRTAPIIKLPASATDQNHLALLAYLNSSTACFWMKQVAMNKGGSGIGRGIQDEAWESRYQFDGSKLGQLPLPRDLGFLAPLGRELAVMAGELDDATSAGDEHAAASVHARMVASQERLDWAVYGLFGLTNERASIATLPAGSRPFEVRLARGRATAWFDRNGYAEPQPPTPEIARLLDAIEITPELALLEAPEYKRRWTLPRATERAAHLAIEQRLDAVESDFGEAIRSGRELAGGAADDDLADLLAETAVPFLAALRFTEPGLARFAAWQATWEAQRAEDRGEKVTPAVPPKYGSGDFASQTIWQLRGKLDVPKERFISYPGCESDEDGEPVYGWAGWDHLQRGQALAALYMKRKTEESWSAERLTPMLAGLLELIPWVKQWHNEPNSEFNDLRMGDYFAAFLADELQQLGLTEANLVAWRPPKRGRASKKPTKSKDTAA